MIFLRMKVTFRIIYLLLFFSIYSYNLGAQLVVPDSTINQLDIREIDASLLEKFQNDPQYHYDDDPRLSSNPIKAWWKNLWRKITSFMEEATSPLVWKVIRILFIIGVILLLVHHLGNSYRSGVMGRKEKEEPGGAVRYPAENLSEVNLNALISSLEEKAAYRSAIRWLYIKTLKDLADKHLLTWDPKFTNQQIINSVKDPSLKSELRALTSVYEYIWYGSHEINSLSAYSDIKHRFDQFIHLQKVTA